MLDRTIVLAAQLSLVRLTEKLLSEPDQHRLIAPHSKFDLLATKRDVAGVAPLVHDAKEAPLDGFLVDVEEVGDLFDRAAGAGKRLDVFGVDLGLRFPGASLGFCELFGHTGSVEKEKGRHARVNVRERVARICGIAAEL